MPIFHQLADLPARSHRFVIVGGGSAGCHVASQLALQQTEPVLLIEAGNRLPGIRSQAPALYPHLFGTSVDWQFATTPQPGLNGRRVPFPRGKVLGGSSEINALIYLQAAESDYSNWGWPSPELPSRTIDSSEESPTHTCPITGIAISPIKAIHPWTNAFLDTAGSAGLYRLPVLLQSCQSVAGPFALTQVEGRRQSTGRLLREKSDLLPNLDILVGAQVERLELTRSAETVCGVHLKCPDEQRVVRIQVEGNAVLSAGAIGSPEILMRSGLGPQELLRLSGMECYAELPQVGQNLRDHLVYPLVYEATGSLGLARRFSSADRQQFRKTGTGPLASNIAEAGAFFELASNGVCERFQIHFTPTHYLKYPQTSEPSFFSLALTQLAPKSFGQVSLIGELRDRLQVAIDPGYLTEAADLEAFSEAVRWAEDAIGSQMKNIAVRQMLPGKRGADSAGRVKSIRAFSQSIYHPTSTCRMGSKAEDSVVDAHFRVHGLRNLYIADASVLPSIPQANTQAATFWAASRLAKILLDLP